MLDCSELARRIRLGNDADPAGLSVVPEPNVPEIERSGEASITLRLGRWFLALRQSSQTYFDVRIDETELIAEARASKQYFVPFGQQYTLHPGRFVLASTLEWLRLPATLGGYIGGKSTWARRGLIIETAAGVHPGFNRACKCRGGSNQNQAGNENLPGVCARDTRRQAFFHGFTDWA